VITIVINALMLGGLYLGWQLEAYPTSYFLISVGAIAALDVILILYKLYKAKKEIAELKARITPTIKLDYDEAEGCLEVIPVYVESTSKEFEARTKYNVKWLRIKVTNESSLPVSGCKPVLVRIQRKGSDGSWKPTSFQETLFLPWTMEAEGTGLDPITIGGGIKRLFLLCQFYQSSKEIQMPPGWPSRFGAFFEAGGVYRFDVAVLTDGPTATLLPIVIEWYGNWNNVRVYKDKVDSPTAP